NAKGLNLTPLFLAIVTFCFSMTVGVMWEVIEYSADRWMDLDMQKDRIVQDINSVSIGADKNVVYHIENIERTVIESKVESGNSIETVIDDGYLDIGIHDTMKDLFVNLLGALVFSVFGYLYAQHDQRRYRFVQNFIPKKKERTRSSSIGCIAAYLLMYYYQYHLVMVRGHQNTIKNSIF